MTRQLIGNCVPVEDQTPLQLQLNTMAYTTTLLTHEDRGAIVAEAEQLPYIGVLPTGGQAHFLTEQESAVPQMPLSGPCPTSADAPALQHMMPCARHPPTLLLLHSL